MDEWGFKGLLDNFGAFISDFKVIGKVDESYTTTSNDAFGESGFSSGDGIVDAEFLFVDLSFASTTDFNNSDFAEKGGSTFFEFFAFVIGFGEFSLTFNEVDTAFDGFLSPAPLIIVVSSLVAITLPQEPRTSMPTSSSFIPLSVDTTVASVRMAISSMISLRRSPKAGALRTSVLKTPLSLLRTRTERASPSTSSAMMTRSLRPEPAHCSRMGRSSWALLIFLSVIRMRGFSKTAS